MRQFVAATDVLCLALAQEFLLWISQLVCYAFPSPLWQPGNPLSTEIQIQIQQLADPHDNAHISMDYSLLFGVGLESLRLELAELDTLGMYPPLICINISAFILCVTQESRDGLGWGCWLWAVVLGERKENQQTIWQLCRQLANLHTKRPQFCALHVAIAELGHI